MPRFARSTLESLESRGRRVHGAVAICHRAGIKSKTYRFSINHILERIIKFSECQRIYFPSVKAYQDCFTAHTVTLLTVGSFFTLYQSVSDLIGYFILCVWDQSPLAASLFCSLYLATMYNYIYFDNFFVCLSVECSMS